MEELLHFTGIIALVSLLEDLRDTTIDFLEGKGWGEGIKGLGVLGCVCLYHGVNYFLDSISSSGTASLGLER